jgi:hypothetical protein
MMNFTVAVLFIMSEKEMKILFSIDIDELTCYFILIVLLFIFLSCDIIIMAKSCYHNIKSWGAVKRHNIFYVNLRENLNNTMKSFRRLIMIVRF